jgi:hypothetical protein
MEPHAAYLKWFFFGCLIALQTLVGVLYKVSQSGSKYSYSTYSAMALAELGKFGISAAGHLYQKQGKAASFWPNASLTDAARILLLACMYFSNNQLTFHLFLWADPASLNLLKAGSSLVTALIWCIFMGQLISIRQWASISLQVLGLVVVQIDACKGTLLLSPLTYAAIGVSVMITALSSVWNEMQLKTINLSLHEQNMILYTGGVLLNLGGHLYMRQRDSSFPSFVQGYNGITLLIVGVNACFGVVVTAVYKYADAILKTLASACTTVVLLLLSFQFFGLQPSLVRCCGCGVVLIAVAQYATTPADKTAVLTWQQRGNIALIGFMVAVAIGVGTGTRDSL